MTDAFNSIAELKDQITQAMHGKISLSLICPTLLQSSLESIKK